MEDRKTEGSGGPGSLVMMRCVGLDLTQAMDLVTTPQGPGPDPDHGQGPCLLRGTGILVWVGVALGWATAVLQDRNSPVEDSLLGCYAADSRSLFFKIGRGEKNGFGWHKD